MAQMPRGRTSNCAVAARSGRRSHYDVLQVSPHANSIVLQAAYRALARSNHPDLSDDPRALQRMREINDAYDLLSDPRKRAMYDLQINQPRPTERSEPTHPKGHRRRTTC